MIHALNPSYATSQSAFLVSSTQHSIPMQTIQPNCLSKLYSLVTIWQLFFSFLFLPFTRRRVSRARFLLFQSVSSWFFFVFKQNHAMMLSVVLCFFLISMHRTVTPFPFFAFFLVTRFFCTHNVADKFHVLGTRIATKTTRRYQQMTEPMLG